MYSKNTPHIVLTGRILISSRYVRLTLFMICGLVACIQPTDSKNEWDWFSGVRTVQFVSQNWRYASELYTAGDSLAIAVVDFVDLSLEENEGTTGLLISANADTEQVKLFQRILRIPSYGIMQKFGSKHPTAYSQTPVKYNGILEIKDLEEHVIIFYLHSYPPEAPLRVMSDTTLVRK